jgi:hypothetical protein
MKTEVMLCCKGNMYEPIRKAIEEAKEHSSKILMTQVLDTDNEVYLRIPISEAGTWVTLLDALADEAADEDMEASLYDDLADTIAEEAEKILNKIKGDEELERSKLPRSKNFWKGI